MDTTYYTFQTRKIKVSSGPDLVTFVPSLQPAPQAEAQAAPQAEAQAVPQAEAEARAKAQAEAKTPAGKILDLDLCRRHLETRAAWKELAAAAQTAWEDSGWEERDQAAPPAAPDLRRKGRRGDGLWVEVCTSALTLALVCLMGMATLLSLG